ncbi:hypothetical protein [Streptomyces fragilis]|uniref:hypothetical protein n=1 Tax=Streptomyces fragilis TaxID=67301 RepID=UPI000D59CDC7|nr:hypothetical protein [Streptomyces fragilis]
MYRIAVPRGGDRAAVTAAVVAMHGRGPAEAAEPGFLRNTGPLSGRAAHPLEKAVHAAPYRPPALLEPTERARVRECGGGHDAGGHRGGGSGCGCGCGCGCGR